MCSIVCVLECAVWWLSVGRGFSWGADGVRGFWFARSFYWDSRRGGKLSKEFVVSGIMVATPLMLGPGRSPHIGHRCGIG